MWPFGKKDKKKQESSDQGVPQRSAQSQKLREDVMAQARQLRAELGEDTIQQMAEALAKQSAGKKARDDIRDLDTGHVADNLKIILDEDKK